MTEPYGLEQIFSGRTSYSFPKLSPEIHPYKASVRPKGVHFHITEATCLWAHEMLFIFYFHNFSLYYMLHTIRKYLCGLLSLASYQGLT